MNRDMDNGNETLINKPRRSADGLEAIFAAVPVILMEVDNNKIYTWANTAGLEFFGGDVIGREASTYFVGENTTYSKVKPVFNGNDDVVYVESWQKRKDGEKRLLAWHCKAVKDSNGIVTGALSSAHDITDVREMEFQTEAALKELRRSEARYRALFEQAAVGVGLVVTGTGQYMDVNKKFCDLVGYSRDELIKLSLQSITHPEDVQENLDKNALLLSGKIREFSIDKRYVLKDGSIVWANLTTSPLWKPGEEVDEYYHIVVIQDITEQKQTEQKLQFLSLHDALTGLNNRAYFEERMEHLEHSRQYPISVLMADVDDLKETNDELGHAAGDILLKRAANALSAAFRVEDVIARIGGDEFSVLLPGTSADKAEAALERFCSIMDELNTGCDGPKLQISCGMSTAEQGDSLVEALKKADANMYLEKQRRYGESR
jgi:diguanylate cyclase (GGDEF)-like protein/PAS domain S-box-containing protein